MKQATEINHSFFGTKQKYHENFNVYSIYAFDKPFIENATHGKLDSNTNNL
jgi:hypothetical protein